MCLAKTILNKLIFHHFPDQQRDPAGQRDVRPGAAPRPAGGGRPQRAAGAGGAAGYSDPAAVQAKADKLWTVGARREMVRALLAEWLAECEEEATLEVLLGALQHENL